ncbi:uncharacterized protein LOC119372197 isoform X3 [Rhipicephalus sanguineus]|uniref:uncharacterized protein LOC119372197 isoform X3 n=1 Tax=Rhipicephalus sanguineus TaxID=34632 RepID=UPI0020C31125|nr:uncharacterized protein LOC119372197 isoform X3 [Rhipicephalus sanguineus]XP_049276193.1 uncharacterized protein LOC119372197 isoform X3 [Rhipicephalus sanguineus]
MGVKRLEYRQNFIDIICVMPLTESTICCEAIASMTNITFLELSSMCFSKDVVRIIGTYVEQATSLTDLELLNIEVSWLSWSCLSAAWVKCSRRGPRRDYSTTGGCVFSTWKITISQSTQLRAW